MFKCPECKDNFDDMECEEQPDCDNIRKNGLCYYCEAEIVMGDYCPKCGVEMEERTHKEITKKQLDKPYYFTKWQYCANCYYVQHKEKYKVINPR